MAELFGAADLGLATNDDVTEACGSPFEVPNVPALGNHYPFMVEDRAKQVSGQDYSKSVKMHEEELHFPTHSDKTKEVAFAPIMGEYLTHKANKAQAFTESYPDENFA